MRPAVQTSAATQQAVPPPATSGHAPALPSLLPTVPRYDGDLWQRSALSGDWGGARTRLAENGVIFEVEVTQIGQVSAFGGRHSHNGCRYSGSVDYALTLDTARLGWWPAGLLYVQGETQFGQSLNRKAGSLMAPNADALFPVPDDGGITTLSNVVYTQFVSERLGFSVGKIDFRGGDQNQFASSETTQFMNLGLVTNPVGLRYVPYSALTAAILVRPADWLTVSAAALDSFGSPEVSGFETAFHSPRGTTFANEWTFHVQPFGLTGHQRFGLLYSTRRYSRLNQDLRIGGGVRELLALRGILRDPDTKPDDFALYYNFDQHLVQEPDDPSQGFGLFGRFGWSDGEVNPVAEFYSLGVGGKGLLPNRDNDTYGVGYYFLNASGDLPAILGINAEQGIELYYNIEVTPWLHITPDLQILIDPGGRSDRDPAIVVGVRMHMKI